MNVICVLVAASFTQSTFWPWILLAWPSTMLFLLLLWRVVSVASVFVLSTFLPLLPRVPHAPYCNHSPRFRDGIHILIEKPTDFCKSLLPIPIPNITPTVTLSPANSFRRTGTFPRISTFLRYPSRLSGPTHRSSWTWVAGQGVAVRQDQL